MVFLKLTWKLERITAGMRSCLSNSKMLSSLSLVVHGDCLHSDAYSQLKLGNTQNMSLADILITDPPYCLLNRRRKSGELRDPKKIVKKVDNQPTVPRYDNLAEYRLFTKRWLKLCVENGLKTGAPLIIWTNSLGKAVIINCCKEMSYTLRGEYLWAKKTNDKPVDKNSTKNEVLLRLYETALVFQHNSTAPSSPEEIRQQNEQDAALPWSVVSGYHDVPIDNMEVLVDNTNSAAPALPTSPHLHPCHKPLQVIEPLIRVWTQPSHIVLDPFSGSGGIAAAVVKVGQGRIVKGIELQPEWAKYVNDVILNN